MTASGFLVTRCQPADLLSLFTPRQVLGLFQGTQWIDWNGLPAGLEILTADRPERLWRIERERFHLIIDTNQSSSDLGAFIDCLAGVSRGVALASARLGTLLHHASRIVAPPAYPQRSSGPFRPRTSGAVLVFRETVLRVVDTSQVLDSATLSLTLPNLPRAVGVLEPSFPGLQADRFSLHLPLRGHHPEEVLGRLREAGVTVTASSVWYRLLQTGPPKS
jgi:hypothetical protein